MFAIATPIVTSRQLERQADEDHNAILESFRNAPPPQPREIGVASPYDVTSEYSVIETGGAEHADSTFVDEGLGLEVNISLHTCRPRVMHHRNRFGELNLVDGSDVDQCTSGGVMSIVDLQRGETFEIHFKLVGAPQGTIGWNARQLVSPRGASSTWHDALKQLRDGLPRREPPGLPPTVQRSGGLVESRDISPPYALLMTGDQDDMLKVLAYRSVFREFYENPDSLRAQQVARMLIDSLLESEEQQELSERWLRELSEAG